MPENVILPYQFEPEFSSNEGVEGELEEEHQHDDENARTRNSDWWEFLDIFSNLSNAI